MVFRRNDEDDEFNIVSEEDEDGEPYDLFAAGQQCDVCGTEDGRVGIDPTCRGTYEGNPILYGYNCLAEGLKSQWAAIEGAAIVVEPFAGYSAHYYYRLDEMPAYSFVRQDIEALSWLMLAVGGPCARCGEQSHVAWLTPESVDARLPENEPVFRALDGDIEHLCNGCTAAALAGIYREMELPLMTAELPRGAMGVLMPTGD